MSWRLGKKLNIARKSSSNALNAEDPGDTSRSTTPTPGNHADSEAQSFSGLLTIRVVNARGLTLPSGTPVPDGVQGVLATQQAQVAASVSPSSVQEARAIAVARGHKSRDSLQRQTFWWLPYLVLEFDVSQVLVSALGGQLSEPTWMYEAHFDVSRSAEISIQIYLRTDASSAEAGKNDLFMGGLKLSASLESLGAADQWYDISGGTGQIQVGVSYRPTAYQSLTIDSFELLKVIGKGSFGKVMQVRKRDTGRIYALKTIRKSHIAEKGEITHTLHERLVLSQVSSPFIVPLKFSFQSESKLYLVLAFVNGGELFHHLQREGRFSEERARFYAAELLLALEHLHDFNIVYRDLKPENILLDLSGHLALCDFGLVKIGMSEAAKTNTFCGTPEYLAPEVLKSSGYNKAVDWWTLGVLLYEMLAGLPPFYDENTNIMYQKILKDPLRFDDDFSADARSILTRLLDREPESRLGAKGADEIKKHPFFLKHIDFKKLMAKRVQPPFKPNVTSAVDTAQFDEVFTSEAPVDSVVEGSKLSQTVQQQFAGFSYSAGHDLSQSPA